MPKYKETPRYNVISMRVSDDERKSLQKLASQNALSISEMMRMAMQVLTFEEHSLSPSPHRTTGTF
jgi:predicted transcriptional regulator